jgi:hypothetical protein
MPAVEGSAAAHASSQHLTARLHIASPYLLFVEGLRLQQALSDFGVRIHSSQGIFFVGAAALEQWYPVAL